MCKRANPHQRIVIKKTLKLLAIQFPEKENTTFTSSSESKSIQENHQKIKDLKSRLNKPNRRQRKNKKKNFAKQIDKVTPVGVNDTEQSQTHHTQSSLVKLDKAPSSLDLLVDDPPSTKNHLPNFLQPTLPAEKIPNTPENVKSLTGTTHLLVNIVKFHVVND